jgi:hypothetical protein
VQRLDLLRSSAPFQRCLRCNDLLEPVLDEDVAAAQLPPRVRERHAAFRRCPACGRLYWPGTHHQRMERLISELHAERAHAPER